MHVLTLIRAAGLAELLWAGGDFDFMPPAGRELAHPASCSTLPPRPPLTTSASGGQEQSARGPQRTEALLAPKALPALSKQAFGGLFMVSVSPAS